MTSLTAKEVVTNQVVVEMIEEFVTSLKDQQLVVVDDVVDFCLDIRALLAVDN